MLDTTVQHFATHIYQAIANIALITEGRASHHVRLSQKKNLSTAEINAKKTHEAFDEEIGTFTSNTRPY